ncbi:DUF6090 family protein [Ekhidna sp.]|uniref:DUF6090 family protein n=1 Tax=Ekhidna sp. TaxID=2608089 RepID=UPI003CCBAAD0
MQKNKVTTYLLYAVGEIVLVVIGILIAVTINQRVAFQKERQEEVEILKEIRANLDNDLYEINQDLWAIGIVNEACDFVSDHLSTKEHPTQEFGREVFKMRITAHFKRNLSGYELLTSRGIKIIQKDSLRRAISNLFETEYAYYNRYELERIDFKSRHLDPFLNRYFLYIEEPENEFLGYYHVTQEDYDQLLQDDRFLKLATSVKRENLLVENRAKRVKTNIIALSSFLDQELNSFD